MSAGFLRFAKCNKGFDCYACKSGFGPMFIEVVTLLRFEILTAKMLRHFSSLQSPTGHEEHGLHNVMVEGWMRPRKKCWSGLIDAGRVGPGSVELGRET